MSSGDAPPLDGLLVVDLSRMLPGAVLARTLADLGARVVKVEDPDGGDPMRHVPPLAGEGAGRAGAGFCAFFAGAESVALDLRTEAGRAAARRLAARADVLVESFRPGTLARFGLAPDALRARNPGLVVVSLSAFGRSGPDAGRVAHDLNAVAESGLLDALGGAVPRAQLADVTAGLLAVSAVLAALLSRSRTGRGRHLDQPIASGPLPLLAYLLAEAGAGGGGAVETLLSGDAPAYGVYAGSDGRRLALAAIEPKFWAALVEALALPALGPHALATGADGAAARRLLAERFRERPLADWLELAAARGLPLSAVTPAAEAASSAPVASRLREVPLPGGGTLRAVGPFLESFAAPPLRPAPALGEGTRRVLAEAGLSDAEIDALVRPLSRAL